MIALLLSKRKLFRTAALLSVVIFPAALHVYVIIPHPGPISSEIPANNLPRPRQQPERNSGLYGWRMPAPSNADPATLR